MSKFKKGDVVEWISQSGGRWNRKVGIVMEVLQAGGCSAQTYLEWHKEPSLHQLPPILRGDAYSGDDRYMVLIPRSGKRGQPIRPYLYMPGVVWLDKYGLAVNDPDQEFGVFPAMGRPIVFKDGTRFEV